MSIHIHQYIVRFDVSEKNKHVQFLVGKNKYNQLLGKMEKTLKSPLDSKKIKPINPKGNQPWIFIWRTDAEAPILWLPDTGKELTHWKRLGKTEGRRRWGKQKMRWLDGNTDSMDMSLSKLLEIVNDREAWLAAGCKRVRHNSATEQQQRHLAGGARYPPWVLFIPLEELVVGPGEPSRFGTVPTWGISDIASM